jgi:hypothetical protein
MRTGLPTRAATGGRSRSPGPPGRGFAFASAPMLPRRGRTATNRLLRFEPKSPLMPQSPLPLDTARIRAEFPAFKQPNLQDMVVLRECRRLLYGGAGAQPHEALLLGHQGAALRLLSGLPRGRPGHGPRPPAHGAGPQRHRRLDSFRPLDLGQHLHAGPRLRRLAEAGRRHRRHQPGSRGQFRRLAQARRPAASTCASGRSTRRPAASPSPISTSCSTARCALSASRTAPTSSARSIPVAEICARARSFGAVTVVDGVSYAPHGLPDVLALGADIYLFSPTRPTARTRG